MRIELISTGDELLTGDITDTNASWLARQLVEQGFKLSGKTTVSDNLTELVKAFRQRAEVADVIIVNGGLGPTSDDLSAEAAAAALNEPLALFDDWVEQMTLKFAAMDRPMSDSNLKQARLPRSAEIVDNPVGTACGFKIQLGKTIMVFTPGVPREFKVMVTEQILPLLRSFNDAQPLTINRFLCFGLGESNLVELLQAVKLPPGCEFGYRAAMPFVELKVFAAPRRQDAVALAATLTEITALLGEHCVVHDGNSLSQRVHQLLSQKNGIKFGTVESCTGGMVVESLVHYGGSSAYLDRGIVTYSNQAKQQLVAVSSETLAAKGAVSIEVVEQMAQGAIAEQGLDLAVSITGIAGPDGGSDDKPVGTVAFALADKTGVFSQMLRLPNRGRNGVRTIACNIALDMVRRYCEGKPVIADYSSFKPFSYRAPHSGKQ